MRDNNQRPLVLVVVIVALILALAFAVRQYRAMTGVSKENTVQMTPDELREAMRRDR